MTTALELAAAIRANDVPRARTYLDANPSLAGTLNNPLPEESFGGLAIGVATRHRSTAMLDLLIEHGADINARTGWWAGGFSVLELCEAAFASELITRGATEDACAAARFGHVDRLRTLLDADDALVHTRHGDGKTPLHYAASIEVAQLLLYHGADIDALDVDHESTPAQYLVSDHPDVARFLVTRGCRTDILLAAALGAESLVTRLLDETPDVVRMRVNDQWFTKQDPRAGGTIYYWSLGSNKSAYVVAREKGYPDIGRRLAERMSPAQRLADLCLLGKSDEVSALREENPDVARELGGEEIPLLGSAIFDRNGEATRLMLASGWPVNVAAAGDGATPLHSAAWFGDLELVRTLLAAGANAHARETRYGGTPLAWASHGESNCWRRGEGNYAAVRKLLEDGMK